MSRFPTRFAQPWCLSLMLSCGTTPPARLASSHHDDPAGAPASTASAPAPTSNATETEAPTQLAEAPTISCIPTGGPVITFTRTPTNVQPAVTRERPQAWGHVGLPLDYPKLSGLPSDWAPQATRTTVITEKGVLVALNDGEGSDSGLYWLPKGEQQPQRVTTAGAADVRWVFSTTFGIIGVSGLCHGACPFRSTVSKLTPGRIPQAWKVKVVAQLDGCPSALSLANSDVLLIANGCSGTLTRVDRKGATTVARWPTELFPLEVTVSPTDSETPRESYYVSFGRVAAKVTSDATQWFAPAECVDADSNETGCHCR